MQTDETENDNAIGSVRRRRPLRSVALVALGMLIGSLVSGVTAAWAAHQFSDVPESNQFHDDIDWLAANGISFGYVDGTFKPTAPVSRQAMAAFMHRLSDRTGLHTEQTDPAPSTAFALTATCPQGSRPIAGGGESDIFNVVMTDSAPLSTGTAGWKVRWESKSGASVDPGSLTVWVTCVPA